MIKNVAEYLLQVEKSIKELSLENTTTTAWFRGHADRSWKLTPSIYRHNKLIEYERDLNRDFKLLSRYKLKNNLPLDEFEWLFIMQHYGMPTRLLDWTESSLVALFFAVEKTDLRNNAVVWILSPRIYNYSILRNTNTVPISSSLLLKDYILPKDNGVTITRQVKARLPLAMRPAKNSERILAQRGVFTIHGNRNICISEYTNDLTYNMEHPYLTHIEIDGRYKTKILKELYQSGISHSVLFPELIGISKDITTRYTDLISLI